MRPKELLVNNFSEEPTLDYTDHLALKINAIYRGQVAEVDETTKEFVNEDLYGDIS